MTSSYFSRDLAVKCLVVVSQSYSIRIYEGAFTHPRTTRDAAQTPLENLADITVGSANADYGAGVRGLLLGPERWWLRQSRTAGA